jgi:integrase
VFSREDGSWVHPERFSQVFDTVVSHLADSGLPRIRLHDLRHTWATLALQAGVPAKVVSEILGHANISITLDTYSHVLPSLAEDATSLTDPMVTAECQSCGARWLHDDADQLAES